uniref:Squalene-tetrahymanol cyclase n=1 Tax=Stygiella incarcerata TaxID=1712417 RepID=H3K1P0_9EUKA|nr:squalene-tetrahymanol cyclase [Stygiella incarcerata]
MRFSGHCFCLFLVCASLLILSSSATPDVSKGRVLRTIHNAVDNNWNRMVNGSRWNVPPYLGSNFVSQYFILQPLVGRNHSICDFEILRQRLLEQQRPDGSWFNVPEPSIEDGNRDTTFFNYFALKVMGEDIDSPHMKAARNWILAHGGLEGTQMFSQIWLSILGNMEWDVFSWSKFARYFKDVPMIDSLLSLPLFVFDDYGLGKVYHIEDKVAQWVYPHVVGMAYLRSLRYNFIVDDPRYCLTELSFNPSAMPCNQPNVDHSRPKSKHPPSYSIKNMVRKSLEIQQPMGSFGAYSVSSLLNVILIRDFKSRYEGFIPESFVKTLDIAEDKGLDFVEWLYCQGVEEYHGVLDDGHYWDSILVGLSLAEADPRNPRLLGAADYIRDAQAPNGGMPYGLEFTYAPDVDDTAEAVLLWHMVDPVRYKDNIERGMQFIMSSQNDDGGWPAFHPNRHWSYMIDYFAGSLKDSAELYDVSSNDVSAHILEAMHATGYDKIYPDAVQRCYKYMKKSQIPRGSLPGRWGVNHIYGTTHAIVGMVRTEIDVNANPWILHAAKWIMSIQMENGGWGESTQSDSNPKWIGKSVVPTHTQTAWALMALLDLKHIAGAKLDMDESIQRGLDFLMSEHEEKGDWFDISAVGTGHRGVLYMQYPSYAISWP